MSFIEFPDDYHNLNIENKCAFMLTEIKMLNLEYVIPFDPEGENEIGEDTKSGLKCILKVREGMQKCERLYIVAKVYDNDLLEFFIEMYKELKETHLMAITYLNLDGFSESKFKILGDNIL